MDPNDRDQRLGLLMARYQAGDAAAFEEMYALIASSVQGYLGRWVGREGAGDLVQETFLHVVQARRTYRPGMLFRPWLFAIARHVALDARRTQRRRWSREVGVDELPDVPMRPPDSEHLDGVRLMESLGRLPDDQREVLWLAKVEGMTAAEIAKVVGASPGAVKVRLHRASARLRREKP